MYIIARGEVEIRKKTEKGEKILMILKSGDVFGEMALIDDYPRSASAVAKGQAALICVDEHAFDELVLNNPQFALKLIKILSKRLRNANHQIYELVNKDMENQVLTGMVNFGKEFGDKTFKGMKINIDDFIEWVNKNLGYSIRDTEYLINYFKGRKVLLPSASSDEELIIHPSIMSRYS